MSSLWQQFIEHEMFRRYSVSIGVVALQCLVAVWAATSDRHWFLRILALWAAIMLMVPIRAWEPAWLFGLSSPLIVGFILMGRWIERRITPARTSNEAQTPTRRYSFSLRDLFLVVLVIAIWLPGIVEVVRNWQPTNWLGWLVSSGSVAVLAVTARAASQTPRRWLHAGLLVLALLEILVALWLGYTTFGIIAAAGGVAASVFAFDRRHWLAVLAVFAILPACAAAMGWAGQW